MDEEAALKKQLETCEDFEERRDIRKKLREFRQKRMDEPNPEPSGRSGRSSRRKEYKEETTTKSSDGVTVTETHTTKKEIVENGDVVTSEERVEVSSKVEDEAAPDDEPEPEPEAEPEQEPEQEQEPEPELEEAEAEAPEETPQEEESENVPPYMQKNPENLTEQEIEEIDDLDFLETTLKQLAIKFFDVRKYLRARIRKVKVSQGTGSNRRGQVARSKGKMFENKSKDQHISNKEESKPKQSKVSSRTKKFEEEDSRKMEKDLVTRNNIGNSRLETDGHVEVKENGQNGESDMNHSEKSCLKSHEEFTIEQFASDTLLNRLEEPDVAQEAEKEPEVNSEDDEEGSSSSSPSATSSTSDMANPPVTPTDDSRDAKSTSSVSAHRLDPLEPGKKKTDFRSQLKKTGFSPKLDLSAAKKASSLGKKDKPEKEDLRKNLKSVPGVVSLTRRGSWSEKYGPSLKDRPSKRTQEEPTRRKISSSDLFNLINKSAEAKEEKTEETQRKTSLTYKYEPPKIVEPKDENFENVMAQRKKSSSRQFNPTDIKVKSSNKTHPGWSPKQLRKATYVPPLPGARKLSVGSTSEGSDVKDGLDLPDEEIEEILKDVDVENIEDVDIEVSKPSPRPTRKISSGNIRWVQGPQINIEDKSQLSAFRSQIEQQKKEKEAGGSYSSTTTKTTEIRGGAGGSTTITKTTTTRGGIGAKAGMRNFEAEMSKKKKERQNAKAEAFKNAKDKRSAFKDQLEASNPKPAGGVKKSFDKPNTAVNALLEWCRRKTRGYENVDLQNYTTSWANGLAMCALFHNFAPENVPWETLDPKDRKRNWTLAFEAAYKEGMDPILELEDVLCTPVPEPRSLITYVHSIYSHFHEKAEKAKAEKEAKNA